ncbi:MAG: hypothetical protein V1804_02555 [Patescibacteria group bacterium]
MEGGEKDGCSCCGKKYEEKEICMKQRNALLSVFNKNGIVEFARTLVNLGWVIYSSGGTAKAVAKEGIPVNDVSTLVGGAAILGHRVVTLSREVHAGLLARYIEEDLEEMEKLGLPYIDLVCVDMYPLIEEINKEGSTPESVIEKTDIGGPTMLRSGAKGRRIVVCDVADRETVITWLEAGEPGSEIFRTSLAAKAEVTVADYCLASGVYHGNGEYAGMIGERVIHCKYGENAYQTPADLYKNMSESEDPLALSRFELVAGDSPSYNNLCDLDRLLQTIIHIAATFDVNYRKVPLIAVGVKHGNACGAAIGDHYSYFNVIQKMIMGDPLAIFGGLLMVTFGVDEAGAEEILTYGMPTGERRLLDGIIAPHFTEGALEMLRRKKDKCRMIINPALAELCSNSIDRNPRFRCVRGGFLAQPNYTFVLDLKDPDLVIHSRALPEQEMDMLLAKAICDTSNSNTITLVNDFTLVGNGVGQQARVYGSRLALSRAAVSKHTVFGASAASDSFFPELDGVEALSDSGIKAIVTSSGSVRDEKVIEFCIKKGIALYMIPDKKGRGFFGH